MLRLTQSVHQANVSRRSVACRAAPTVERVQFPSASLLEDVPAACPCVAAVDVLAAKDKCIHPQRPISQACQDCPRRKGRAAAAELSTVTPVSIQVLSAKSKCIHPQRPVSEACGDCPRRKGRAAIAALTQEQPLLNRANLSVYAAKSKCVHPTRPVKDACPDCPRRR